MKNLRFVIACILLPFINFIEKWNAKYVYIHISWKQLYLMYYKDMDRIEAYNYLKNGNSTGLNQ